MSTPRNLKTQLIIMWLYVFVVYLSFFRHMITAHYVSEFSLSHIGWVIGDMRYLLVFLTLALPFCLYAILFINRNFVGSNNRIRTISVFSCTLMVIGGLIPLGGEYRLLCFIHVLFSMGGAIGLMLTILAALILHALKSKQKTVIFLLYGLYVAAILVAFAILMTAAFFQMMVTFSFMLTMLIFISVTVKQDFFHGNPKTVNHEYQVNC